MKYFFRSRIGRKVVSNRTPVKIVCAKIDTVVLKTTLEEGRKVKNIMMLKHDF